MKVPLSWLREYVDVDMPLDELATKINDATAEVEGIEFIGGSWDRDLVRVAEVVAVDPHPNADRLRLATVETGNGRQQVVCGAPNLAVGQKVAFATEGAELVDGHTGKVAKLKLRPIRGVESAGMVLSEKELELPPDSPIGAPLVDVLGDAVLDITTWANRADLLGVHGVAREVAALTGRAVRDPESTHGEGATSVEDRITVTVEDPDLCPRFTASFIEGVKIGPSPAWLQERLLRVGMRPINNVVDITNYVMLETGQPLHAFDYDRIRGKKIIARRAKPGEKLTTLDDIERDLDPDMLMICDGEGPVGLAGVMGGGNSEVSESTTNVLLEIANFNPGSIRRTSTLLKLRTEASLRFEKGLGPEVPLYAQHRALHLFEQLTGGTVAAGIVDVYPGKQPPKTIILEAARIRGVLGIEIAPDEVRDVLGGLGFLVHHLPPDRYSVQPPYWRPDVEIPEDVIEDLGRIYGYDKLPATSLEGALPEPEFNAVYDVREELRDAAVAAGLQEVINYTLTDLPTLAKVVPAGLARSAS
jgi:phenylalanyl-tRNA synthetase beta chain